MATLFFIRHGETEANVDGILTGTLETNLTKKDCAGRRCSHGTFD